MHQDRLADNMKRTTVSFEDDQYEILKKWANKEVRTVPNLITAIVVSVLRGETPQLPKLDGGKGKQR
jgi:predicted DNA-binding ribbon-helix-helix protein